MAEQEPEQLEDPQYLKQVKKNSKTKESSEYIRANTHRMVESAMKLAKDITNPSLIYEWKKNNNLVCFFQLKMKYANYSYLKT